MIRLHLYCKIETPHNRVAASNTILHEHHNTRTMCTTHGERYKKDHDMYTPR